MRHPRLYRITRDALLASDDSRLVHDPLARGWHEPDAEDRAALRRLASKGPVKLVTREQLGREWRKAIGRITDYDAAQAHRDYLAAVRPYQPVSH